MKTRSLLLMSASCFGICDAREEGLGYQDTPILPGTEYHVHDGERPQPRVIETGGAVEIKPPSDAKLLFDGKTLEGWVGKAGAGAQWIVEDGITIAKDEAITSREEFGAVQVHLEWRVPAERKVKGQKGGNSGIFLMGKYEVQILQSNNNPTYPDGQAGSLYGQLPPLVNATSPQGEWNSYDIFFEPPVYEEETVKTPARITIIHNGIVVQNGEYYTGPTGHKTLGSYPKTHPKTGPITMQWHGDPIEFKNFWVRPLGERDETE